MMRMTCVLFLITLFPFALACGDDPSPKEEVDSSIEEYKSADEQFSKEYCVCYADILYNGDMNQCVREKSSGDVLPTKCEQSVAECYADDFTVYMRCNTNALDEFRRCMSSCPTSSAQIDACVNTANMRQQNCNANLPADVKINMDACTAGEKFSCD